jgi:hypothetical protein
MKRVKCDSGIMGWKDRLQKVYHNFEEFQSYSQMYGISKRLGFKSDQAVWKKNPIVQGSVNTTDLKIVNS